MGPHGCLYGQALLAGEWPCGKARVKDGVGAERDEKDGAYAWSMNPGKHTALPASDI